MKKISFLIIFALTGLISSAFCNSTDEIITFYKVPLVCGAASDIGCGSRAKPALLEMEQNSAIKEAWLNREGTLYAIVWKTEAQTKAVAKPIFKKHFIDFTEVKTKEASAYVSDFRKEGKWLRGADVDKLSIEEAGRIAETATGFLVNSNAISPEEAAKIKTDVEAYFKIELVKIRTLDELTDDSQNKFQQAIIVIYEKHLGKDRTEKIKTEFGQKIEEEKQKGKDCCKKKKDSCCKKS